MRRTFSLVKYNINSIIENTINQQCLQSIDAVFSYSIKLFKADQPEYTQ